MVKLSEVQKSARELSHGLDFSFVRLHYYSHFDTYSLGIAMKVWEKRSSLRLDQLSFDTH